MNDAMSWILAAGVFPLLGYLCGSVPFGFLAGRIRGVDLRKVGSGNVGATNAVRVLGKGWGYSVFLLDVLKGAVPVFLVGLWLPWDETFMEVSSAHGQGVIHAVRSPMVLSLWLLTAFAVIAGHVWPVWLRFKGGKGVATSLGVVLAIYPFFTWPGLVALGVWVVVVLIGRYVSLASIAAAITLPAALTAVSLLSGGQWHPQRIWPLLVFAWVMALLVVWKHRSNISRLLAGTENRIGRRGKQQGDDASK